MTTKEFNDITSKLGLSTKELASKLDRSVSSVKCYISGERAVPEEIADKMRSLLTDTAQPENAATPTPAVVLETIYSRALKAIKQCEDKLCETMLALEKIELTPETLEVHRGLTKAHEPISRYADKLEEMEANTLKLVKVVSR